MRLGVLGLVLVAGCMAATPLPAPPAGVRTIAVLPPVNRTTHELVVSGGWYLERLLGNRRATAPEVLAAEAAQALARQGFSVVAPGTAGAAALQITLRRFDADTPDDEFVITDLDASLTDGGRVVWQATRRGWIVPTRGAPSVAEAWAMAARTVADALVDGWRPAAAP